MIIWFNNGSKGLSWFWVAWDALVALVAFLLFCLIFLFLSLLNVFFYFRPNFSHPVLTIISIELISSKVRIWSIDVSDSFITNLVVLANMDVPLKLYFASIVSKSPTHSILLEFHGHHSSLVTLRTFQINKNQSWE